MLRDEGGRQADEDSKLYVISRKSDTEQRKAADLDRQAHGSPPPRARRSSPPPPPPGRPRVLPRHVVNTVMEPPRPQEDYDIGLRTIAPTRDSPRPAVIVGLAKAAAAQKSRRSRSGARAAAEEPTQQITSDQARLLAERFEGDRRRYPEEMPTAYQPIPPSLMRSDDEATRQVHVSRGGDLPIAAEPLTRRTSPPRSPAPLGANRGRTAEDPTHAAVDIRDGSLSEVDWDLD
jgi:hypothetical protein